MMILTTGTTAHIRVTLTERVTLAAPYYLFRFVQRTTNEEIRFVVPSSDDLSAFPARYNEFALDIDQIFCGEIGEYQYYIYQQTSAWNTELDNTGTLLEQGLARLETPTEDNFTFKAFAPENTYITA
jgi:hypothetical protein